MSKYDLMMQKKRRILIFILSFILILIGMRVLWMVWLTESDQPYAVNGELDLRDWDTTENQTFTLDGEWEFYPNILLMKDKFLNQSDLSSQLIQVPGGWNASLLPNESTPYGYGSYRLRILVDPSNDPSFSMRIPSVRSSSEVYVNGRLLGRSGQPAASEENYKALNEPYTVNFSTDGTEVIEVVVQAANFIDYRKSGIVRSIRFGTEEAIHREVQLSITMQHLACITFLMHAVYAVILYLLGNREKKLLYFSLLLFCVQIMFLLGNDDKLLTYWFPINYDWSFRLLGIAMTGAAYFLLQCMRQPSQQRWLDRMFRGYAIVCGVEVISLLLLPMNNFLSVWDLYHLISGISLGFAFFTIFRLVMKGSEDSLLLLMALIAITSNFAWWTINMATGTKLIYYPFDLIIAVFAYASIWFKRYFRNFAETRNLAAKLQKADQQKDEFLANTSHELRNPLHSILNMTQIVLERDRYSLNNKSVEDLKLVLKVGRRMSFMLDDLLDLMRLKDKNIRLQPQAQSISIVVDGVMDMLHYMTHDKPIRLMNRIPKLFPAVLADEHRLVQIVFNLLHNAVKYTDKGEISVQAYEQNGQAHIVIADTGIGMDEELIKRIFEPYEQASRETIGGGFGLGLSISKQLVELHKGDLWVRSTPGQGSDFTFTLPFADSDVISDDPELLNFATSFHEETAAVQPSDLSYAASERLPIVIGNRRRILVVDDDAVNLQVLINILSTEQYQIVTAKSGVEALDILEDYKWDLIIADVMMPYMSGHEFTRRIRERFSLSELPVLLLTARTQAEDIHSGFLAGANDYVTKPVDALELRSRVRMLTDLKRSVSELLRMEAAYLQAQIQPHFLFNTLNSITALSDIDTAKMNDLIEAFSSYLRISFDFWNSEQMVSLEHELELVRAYLFIEKERFEDRLQVEWEIDRNIHLLLPPLTIQPLVENAVRHGVLSRSKGGTVYIQIRELDYSLKVTIKDNGAGMDEHKVRELLKTGTNDKIGIGLLNTDRRLKQLYGKGLLISSKPGEGTSISFEIPK